MKKISVITVCYNAKSEIEDTIRSVISQTYPNFEYIVIDGGSNDGTVEIIKKYVDKITYWVSEPDKGIYDAMNKGIEITTGDWVNFMNAGDRFVSGDVLMNVFGGNAVECVDVIYGDAVLNYHKYGKVYRSYANLTSDDEPLNINHQSSFVKGDVIRKHKYDLCYKIASDGNTFKKIKNLGGVFQYVSTPIAVFEVVSGVSSKQLLLRTKEYMIIQGIKPYSYRWIKSMLKAEIKMLFSQMIPNRILMQMQYKRIKNKYSRKCPQCSQS